MKEIYYYEITDDGGITWQLGEPSFSLINCVDKARRACYASRITKCQLEGLGSFVTNEEIERSLAELIILDKLFQ